jgi:hypothetical protein
MRKKAVLIYLDRSEVKFLDKKVQQGCKVSSYIRTLIDFDMMDEK